jgi:hypothetical protein
MSIASETETPAEIRAKAQRWFDAQVEISRKSLGSDWPKHEAWVIAYLKEELRDRLIERGWRPKNER